MTNRKLAAWSAFAIIIGVPLCAPKTSLIIPNAIANRPDSIWFYVVPLLGMCLFGLGAIILIKIAFEALASRL